MSDIYRYLFLLTIIFGGTAAAFAQDAPRPVISGNFRQTPFPQFVKEVESQTGCRIYFDATAMDSLTVTSDANGAALATVLDSLFKDTDYRYTFHNNHLYITKGREIRTELPVGFFSQNQGATDYDVAMFDFMGKDKSKEVSQEAVIHEIGKRTNRIKSGTAHIAGNIRDVETGEPVIGAVVYHEESRTGVATDPFGYYSITVPTGRGKLKISCVGMKEAVRQVMVYSDGKLDIELTEFVTPLKEVVVESERGANISGMQMGMERLDIRTLKQVPVALGEADIMKVVLTLPGVQSVGENSTGLNVRGGATDQNLILFNDAVVYNPSHLFGFFSAFNPDVLKNVELYKSGIPAEHGGRLSSVLEIDSKEGNRKKFSGSGGLGLITGRLTLEGPIIKDKMSFLVGGRSTYSNWLLSKIPDDAIKDSRGSFYDIHTHISSEINEKNSVYLSAYLSSDKFRFNTDTLYQYSNINSTLKWKHIFKNQLFGIFTTTFSRYQYDIASEANPVNAFNLDYTINQSSAKADFNYFHNAKHSFTFGAGTILYKLQPGRFLPSGTESSIAPDIIQDEQALESAIYVGDQIEVTSKLSVYAGLRYSFYNYLGPRDVIRYAAGLPREINTVLDTVAYGSGNVINTYQGPEYRFSARYILPGNASVKFSFHRMRQYIHMLSNTTAIAPTDVWKLSDPHIRPQVGDQVSLGFYKNFKANTIEASVEGYYKPMRDFLDYKSGATLIMNHTIERDVVSTKGEAYGVEFMVKKVTGKLNGWISYTYSRSLLRTEDKTGSETINRGAIYPSNFDKPHDVTLISNYKFSRRFSLSLNFTYSTGRPITYPLAMYEYNGTKRLLYQERNQGRIPDYYRADFSMNVEGNHKIRKLAHSSWSFSVYNLTGRKNAYSVYFVSENGQIKGYKLSIFAQPIPTITYNFKF